MRKLFALLLMFTLSVPGLQAQNIDALKAKYRKSIADKMKKLKVAGASMALVHGKQTVWAEGFGFADVKQQVKATANTKFMLASVTKTFTTTAIMQLHEKGKVNINQPIKNYVPQLNISSRFGKTDPITLKNIMTHHAGLPSDILRGMMVTKAEDFTKIIAYLNKSSMAFPPNLIRAYSNPGFSVLGCAIQAVSGEKYAQYLKKHIFDPLQMSNSGVFNGGKYPTGFTKFYNHKGKQVQELALRDVPAGAMFSSANDLSQFIKAMFFEPAGQRILNKKTLKQIFKVQNKGCKLDLGTQQGLCWFIREDTRLGRIFSHAGDTRNTHALLAVIPELSLGVAFASNSANSHKIRKIAIELMKEYAQLKNLSIPSNEIAPEAKRDFKRYTLVKKNHQELKKIAGHYANAGFGAFEIKLVNDTLQGSIAGTFAQFLPAKKGDFLLKVKGAGIITDVRIGFETMQGQQVMIQTQTDGSKDLIGNKVYLKPINKAWKNRVGKYKIINALPGEDLLFVNYELVHNKGYLTLKVRKNIGNGAVFMAVQPLDNQKAYTLGIGRQGGNYLYFSKNKQGQEVLNIHGYQLVPAK